MRLVALGASFEVRYLVEWDIVDENQVVSGTAAPYGEGGELSPATADTGQGFYGSEDVAHGTGAAAYLFLGVCVCRNRCLRIFHKQACRDDQRVRGDDHFGKLNFDDRRLAAHHAHIGFEVALVSDVLCLKFVNALREPIDQELSIGIRRSARRGSYDDDVGTGQGLFRRAIKDGPPNVPSVLSQES